MSQLHRAHSHAETTPLLQLRPRKHPASSTSRALVDFATIGSLRVERDALDRNGRGLKASPQTRIPVRGALKRCNVVGVRPPVGFVGPWQLSHTEKPPIVSGWLHEIKTRWIPGDGPVRPSPACG